MASTRRPDHPYRTYRRSRGNRLPRGLYPPGRPVHVTIGTAGDRPPFLGREVADPVFEAIASHAATLTACLMPDHLHWLVDDAARVVRTVQGAKSYTTHLARRAGHAGPLWQRSFWDHVVRRREGLEALACYILDNPTRAGLVARWQEYPYSVIHPERLGG